MIKKLIIRVCFFIVCFFLLDKLMHFVIEKLPELELDKRLEYIVNGEIDADVIILGSSGSARGILAKQLEDSLKTGVYNLSYPGSDISFQKYVFEQQLINAKVKPKILILGIDEPTQLLHVKSNLFRLDRLYPLIKYPTIRDTLLQREGKNLMLGKYLFLYQMNKSNLVFKKKEFTNFDSIFSDGSMPIRFTNPKYLGKLVKTKSEFYDIKNESKSKVNAMKAIIPVAGAGWCGRFR
jgi:hypothetical protein